MSYDRDTLLNALQKTGAVEVKLHGEEAYTTVPAEDAEALREYAGRMESALALLSAATEEYNAQNGIKSGLLKDGFEVSYSDFMSAGSRRAETDAVAARIETLAAQKSELSAQLSAVERAIREAAVYAALDIPFRLSRTRRTSVSGWVRFRLPGKGTGTGVFGNPAGGLPGDCGGGKLRPFRLLS